jgi:hypothetical protein
LKCLGLKEGLLYRMKMFATRKAFDGRDFFSHRCPSRSYATPNRSPVEQNGTGAALAFTTAILGPRQFEPIAQHVQKRLFGRCLNRMFTSIHRNSESHDLTSKEV